MRPQWAQAFTELALKYWTPERTQALVGDKNLPVLPTTAPLLLRALGLLHRDASMPPEQVRKYRQINHMVTVLGPMWRTLMDRFEVVRILDAGCGRSYLTALVAWCFVHKFDHPVEILGIDRNADLVEECRRRAEICGLDAVLRYEVAELAHADVDGAWRRQFGGQDTDPRVHALVSLHACDTATDDAIALAVERDLEAIAVAPCCQAELAARWAELAQSGQRGVFWPVWEQPHIRRQAAAVLTDVFRGLLLRGAGYQVRSIEFVASAHTPKNTLIWAARRLAIDPEALAQYLQLRRTTGGAGIALEQRLPERIRAVLRELRTEAESV